MVAMLLPIANLLTYLTLSFSICSCIMQRFRSRRTD